MNANESTENEVKKGKKDKHEEFSQKATKSRQKNASVQLLEEWRNTIAQKLRSVATSPMVHKEKVKQMAAHIAMIEFSQISGCASTEEMK